MKTKIFTIILLFFSFFGHSQQIQNADFENWTLNTYYEEPNGFGTTNLQSYFTIGSGNVSKTNDSQSGIWAAHLLTVAGNPNPVTAGLFIGSPGPGGLAGGVPYTDKPVAVQWWAKYNIMPNDTGTIMVFLKKNGNLMAATSMTITGVQFNYTQYTAPFFWFDTVSTNFPDTMVAIFASSSFNNPIAGSELYIDNITFMGAAQLFPNGGFETWTPVATEDPDNWFSFNVFGLFSGAISATKTTDHYGTGAYALQLETIVLPNGNSADTMGFITNGRFGNNGPEGGMKVNSYPMRVSGYYKYTPVGLDTALAGLFLFANNVLIDSALVQLSPTNAFTYFEMNLNYQGPSLVDTLNITFSSSNMIDSTNWVGAGSILIVDKLMIEYYPMNISENQAEESDFEIYPNPTTDFIQLKNVKSNSRLVVYDIKGSIVLSKELNKDETISVSELEKGIYTYYFEGAGKSNKGKLIIGR